MRPRHVIVVTPRFGGRDGISAVARQFAAALPPIAGERTLEIWSLGDNEAPADLAPGVTFRAAAGRRLSFAWRALRAAGSMRDALVIVTHVHLLPVVLPLTLRGARVVPVLEGIEVWKPLRALEHWAMGRAWRVLAISQHTIERFKAANPAFADRPVQVCHPSVPDCAEPSPDRITGRFALIVARMAAEERYKGHDVLLDLWPEVRCAVPDAELVIAGDGDDRPRLQQRAAALGLHGCVRFTGRLHDAQLAACYRDAALFVMPSRDEGFGLVFLEAMRAGTPCIAARGAAAEIVRDEIDGFVVEHGDPKAVTAAIVTLLTNCALRERMGAAGQAHVARRFTAAHFAKRVHRALELEEAPVPC